VGHWGHAVRDYIAPGPSSLATLLPGSDEVSSLCHTSPKAMIRQLELKL
jgi:hypothetical protein